MFEKYTKIEQTFDIWTGVEPFKSMETGTVQITLVYSNSTRTVILLKEVLHVFKILTNLVLVFCLQIKRVYWRLDNFTLWMIRTHAEIEICKFVRSLFVLQIDEA